MSDDRSHLPRSSRAELYHALATMRLQPYACQADYSCCTIALLDKDNLTGSSVIVVVCVRFFQWNPSLCSHRLDVINSLYCYHVGKREAVQ